jgi:hypothetical protein
MISELHVAGSFNPVLIPETEYGEQARRLHGEGRRRRNSTFWEDEFPIRASDLLFA